MLPDAITDYLDKCKKQGVPFGDVEKQLAQNGWGKDKIGLAKQYYDPAGMVAATEPAPVVPADEIAKAASGLQIITAEAVPERKKNGGFKVAVVLIVVAGGVTAVSGIPAYMIATEKLNLGDANFKQTVSEVVFSLPFIQKTPKFILESAISAQKKVQKNSIDLSLAVQSEDLTSLVGLGNLDAEFKGYVNLADSNNPKLDVTVNITKDFSAQIRKNDKMVYFKVNKMPASLLNLLGMEQTKFSQIMQNWIAYDTSPLLTEARKNLDQVQSGQTTTGEEVNKVLLRLANEQILPKIKVTDDKVETTATYKLTFEPDEATLNIIGDQLEQETKKYNQTQVLGISTAQVQAKKLADYIQNLNINLWIGKNDYYLRKGTITFIIKPGEGTPGLKSPVKVSLAMGLSDFGKDITIETPTDTMTPEEAEKQLMEGASSSGLLSPVRQFSQSNNTKRRSDILAILNGLGQYAADHKGNLPPGIKSTPEQISSEGVNICSYLLPDYLAAIPVDPKVNNGQPVTECKGSYATGYTIMENPAKKRLTVNAPEAELGEIISVTR